MTTNKRILAAASTNGGAEAVAPVVLRLREKGSDVRVLSYAAATATFRAMKIEPDRILDGVFGVECAAEMAAFRPATVLTGTQVQDDKHPITLEQMLWGMGKAVGVRSVAVLDTWANYIQRFSDLEIVPGGLQISHLSRLPDKIAIMDEFARARMLELDFPASVLEVTGNPYFEYIAGRFASLSPATREELLARPVFSPFRKYEKLVVFFSDSMDSCPDIGFTEVSVLRSFLKVLDSIAGGIGLPNVIVRPHPFRNSDAGEAFACETPNLAKVLHNPITARGADPANDYTMEQLLYSADIIVGTFNNPLETAKICGKDNVISYVPGMNPKYDYQSYLNEQGLTTRVFSEEGLAPVLEKALAFFPYGDGLLGQKRMESTSGAADNVIKLL